MSTVKRLTILAPSGWMEMSYCGRLLAICWRSSFKIRVEQSRRLASWSNGRASSEEWRIFNNWSWRLCVLESNFSMMMAPLNLYWRIPINYIIKTFVWGKKMTQNHEKNKPIWQLLTIQKTPPKREVWEVIILWQKQRIVHLLGDRR